MHSAPPGGAPLSLRYLIENFPTGSVEPYLLCPYGYAVQHFKRAGVTVFHIPGVSMLQSIAGVPLRGLRLLELVRTFSYMRYGHIIRKTIDKVRPDIVHLNERGMLHAARIAHKIGIPVVMHARSLADRRTRWIKYLTDRFTLMYVNRAIAIDESVKRSLRELEYCVVIYNPINILRSTRGALKGRQQYIPGKSSQTKVTFLSNLLEYKGIWDLLESASILRERRDIVFQVAGGNSRPRSFHQSTRGKIAHALGLVRDLESAVKAWLVREGLQEKVLMFGHVEEIDEVLENTDILVFPSRLNGVGRSVLEAGALGIPSIVTLADMIEDIVEDGVTGLITPERDPKALAEAITRLADNPELRVQLGINAQRKYLLQFDPRKIGRQVLNLYQSLVGK